MKKLPVFYTPKMVADSGAYSPSAAKPAKLMAAWCRSDLEFTVHEPAPATDEELCRAHDPAYVRGVLDGHVRNGFGNTRTDVILSLPYTSGALLAAARHAVDHPEGPPPCATVSGFHHAGYKFGGGFCTFNGLMVAALALLEDRVDAVGILDADMHYGNGTDDVLRRINPALRARVYHITFAGHADGNYRTPEQAERFLAELPGVVRRMASRVGVILYQAGADPHVDDPLGGWLTTEQLALRDKIVFETARAMYCPVAWVLAGGYQVEKDGSIPKVLEVHTNTALAALASVPS